MKIHFLLFTLIATVAGLGCNDVPADGHLIVPDGTTTIDDNAFEECSALKSVVIPDSVTTINFNAFANCDALKSIVIPDSVTTIGDYAFYFCPSLAL